LITGIESEEQSEIKFETIREKITELEALIEAFEANSNIPQNAKIIMKSIGEILEKLLDTDNIKNLCLLDGPTNSAIGNNNFRIKREKILDIDKKGEIEKDEKIIKVFIPAGTRNVFLKYYSKDRDNINFSFWGLNDRSNYLEAIGWTIKEFLKQ
jgi:hypothetical protein